MGSYIYEIVSLYSCLELALNINAIEIIIYNLVAVKSVINILAVQKNKGVRQ